MRRFANYCLAALFAAAWLDLAPRLAISADGYLIRLTADKRIEVVPFRPPTSGRVTNQTGIAIWRQGAGEQWASLPGKLPTVAGSSVRLASALNSSTRGGVAGMPAGTGQATFQPDQLMGTVVVRAGETSFLTPADQGHHLEPKITIRRRPTVGDEPYPAATATLRAEEREALTIEFAAGQSTVRWADLADLPNGLRNGLPPGECSLQLEGGPITNFVVEESEEREWVLEPLAELGELIGRDDPLYVIVAVQTLLDQTDSDGKPRQYLSDAFDLVDHALANHRDAEGDNQVNAAATWLLQFHERLKQRLLGQQEKASADVAPTGIETIDRARLAIAAGNVRTADAALDEALVDPAPRTRGLALLYRGVLAGESDAADRAQADVLFQQAGGLLAEATAEDRFRLHNNYASVLFGRARDQVHNHAFQMATGASRPLLNAVGDWSAALKQYQLAQGLAAELPPAMAASVQINLAQLYALLADLIAVLDYTPDGVRKFAAGEAAATAAAAQAAEQVLADNADQLDPLSRGAAHEVLAQLAYRAEEGQACVLHAAHARGEYLAAGSLAGVESIERLWGLALSRDVAAEVFDEKQNDEGFKHLRTSHLLADVLRSRIPAGQAGVSRAGFLARRGYVNERLIELSIARKDYAGALAYAEAGKARSLQDLFQARKIAAAEDDDSRELSDILAEWPDGVVAVEYFLGTLRSVVFVVSGSGEVQAWPLVAEDGQPVPSRELVRRVQQLTSGMEGQAAKMLRGASAGKGFDQSWQGELHAFYNVLWPAPLREMLSETKTVIVVPHHILHYFPFAALVTEVDPAPRGKLDQPQPRFLVDEPFALCKAPSLVAWDVLRRKPSQFSQVQAVGIVEFDQAGRLPGVEQDLANLKRIFGGDLQQVVAAREATEGRIQDVLRQPGMLFIGTHGKNLPEHPLASFLLCHGDKDHDGQLTAGEVFAGEVGANLVVMSACYSGLADRSPLPGDDLFGLERALLTAGASTVVSGLWDVYDDTGPLLMAEFLQQLQQRQPAAEALAGAQRSFLARRRQEGPGDPWIHPYFWSVYSVAGSEQTMFSGEVER